MNSVDPKPPGATKLYSRDWSGDLASGETITGSNWTFSSAAVTGSLDSITGAITSVLISGGTEGQQVYVTNTIDTSAGQHLPRVGELMIRTEGLDA